MPNDFESAKQDLIGKSGFKAVRKIGNNTWVEADSYSEDDVREVSYRLHNTRVVTFRNDGSIIVNTGHWRTVTTKQRINEHIPRGYWVSSIKGDWKVEHEGFMEDFEDGMDITKI